MFQFSRRQQNSVSESTAPSPIHSHPSTSRAPRWAMDGFHDRSNPVISQTNIASACPYCTNYDLTIHLCTLYGEPIPLKPDESNPCKGNTFSRRFFSGNRLDQLRSLRKG